MDNMRDLVLKIHATPHKVVLAITGGGAEAIGELLRHGQGSNTLLEAVVPYDQKAFDRFVRGTPDKYCSQGAANDLAMAAYQRGLFLTEGVAPTPPIIGAGVSCSLAKDNERVGRKHHAYLAFQTEDSTYCYEVQLGDAVRTRNEQEALVAQYIIKGIALMSGMSADTMCLTNLTNGVSYGLSTEYIEVAKGQRDVAPSMIDRRSRVIFPGSFNPLHEQHERIAEVVAKITGYRVDLEVCVFNVDKPALSYATIAERRDHLIEKMYEKPWAGQLLFTSTSTFVQKAAAFPESTFVVGWDTFSRISDPKYGNLEDVIRTFDRHKIRFLVFDRLLNGKSAREMTQHLIHPSIMGCSSIIGPDTLPPVEMASSTIRKGQ